MANMKLFEGDMVPHYHQILQAYGPNVTEELVSIGVISEEGNSGSTENGSFFKLWPNRVEDVVEVPYMFVESFIGNKFVVEEALRDLEKMTGVVRFVRRSTQTNYIRVDSKTYQGDDMRLAYNCWSYVGHQMHEQDLNLGPGCDWTGIIQHEFLHALGFWHESSRWDRDDYVTVMWENIPLGLEFEFRKRSIVDTLGSPYDYFSIMHGAKFDFSTNGLAIMDSPQPIGQLDSPSQGDIMHLRLLYQCHSGPRTWSDYMDSPCTDDCKCWEMATGCHENDDACQGELICQANVCVYPHAVAQPTLVLAVGVGLLLLYGLRHLRRHDHRRTYETL